MTTLSYCWGTIWFSISKPSLITISPYPYYLRPSADWSLMCGINIRCQALEKLTPTLNIQTLKMCRIARCCCCSVKTTCLVLGVLLTLGNLYGRSQQIIQIFILNYNIITCYICNRQALAICKWVYFARIPLIAWSYLRMWGHLDNVLYLSSLQSDLNTQELVDAEAPSGLYYMNDSIH